MVKKIVYALLALLIVIQLFRPSKNIASKEQVQSINKAYTVPQNVAGILNKACYDCHSNTTVYPWYTNIQPIAWWMDDHINEGKRKLNFSEFAAYSLKKQDHKLEEFTEQIVDEMPLTSYKLAHSEARLTVDEKKALTDWANALRKEIQNKI